MRNVILRKILSFGGTEISHLDYSVSMQFSVPYKYGTKPARSFSLPAINYSWCCYSPQVFVAVVTTDWWVQCALVSAVQLCNVQEGQFNASKGADFRINRLPVIDCSRKQEQYIPKQTQFMASLFFMQMKMKKNKTGVEYIEAQKSLMKFVTHPPSK